MKTFYKYRNDSEYTEKIFVDKQVFLSTAEKLNDPFECTFGEIGKEWIAEKVKEMKQGGVTGFLVTALRTLKKDVGFCFFGASRSQVDDTVKAIKAAKSTDDAYKLYSEFMVQHNGHPPSDCDEFFRRIDIQLQYVGIFSMSELCDHPLMWAHYAGEHSGICISFERTQDSRLSNPNNCLKVIYSDSLPTLDDAGCKSQMSFSVSENGRLHASSFRLSFSDPTFQKAICTKPTCWSYEHEWRYVESSPGPYPWPAKITEVTFGMKCPHARREHYVTLIEKYVPHKVRLYKMQKVSGSNTLKRVPYDQSVSRPSSQSEPLMETHSNDSENMDTETFGWTIERLILAGNYGEAISHIEDNLLKEPDSPFLLSLKGDAHGHANQHDKALVCFDRLTKLCPEQAFGWYQLACAYIGLEQHEEAATALRQAFALDPNDPSTVYNLGIELHNLNNDSDEALTFLKRAEDLGHKKATAIIAELEKMRRRGNAND